MPQTAVPVMMTGSALHRGVDGKATKRWVVGGELSLLQQLGLLTTAEYSCPLPKVDEGDRARGAKRAALPRREALIKTPHRSTTKVRTLPVPDPPADPDRVAAVKARYLTTYFRRQPRPTTPQTDPPPQGAPPTPLRERRQRQRLY